MTKKHTYDVVIIGAGLSGLTTGIALQLNGMKTRIIEKNTRAGGLCGNYDIDGYEFTRACNDFGLGMKRILDGLGVRITFEKKKTLIHHANKVFSLPPNPATFSQLLLNAPSVIKYYNRALGAKSDEYQHQDINTFVNEIFKKETINSLLKIPSYLMGVSPNDFYVKALAEEGKYKYGYHQPLTPEGGPDALVESLVERYQELGGELTLNCSFYSASEPGPSRVLSTSIGELSSSDIVYTHDWSDHESQALKTGLPISVLHIAAIKSLDYPPNVHTMVHYPKDINIWFNHLDSGKQPDAFGFHLFKCGTQKKYDYIPINVYFYQPRNESGNEYTLEAKVENYILDNIESMLPGFKEAIIYKRYISPDEFTKQHGLSSRVMPFVMPAEFEKPTSLNRETMVYHAGNAAHPPGDHAGAAIQSAIYAAKKIASRKSS